MWAVSALTLLCRPVATHALSPKGMGEAKVATATAEGPGDRLLCLAQLGATHLLGVG